MRNSRIKGLGAWFLDFEVAFKDLHQQESNSQEKRHATTAAAAAAAPGNQEKTGRARKPGENRESQEPAAHNEK